jgi:hypothetical protein
MGLRLAEGIAPEEISDALRPRPAARRARRRPAGRQRSPVMVGRAASAPPPRAAAARPHPWPDRRCAAGRCEGRPRPAPSGRPSSAPSSRPGHAVEIGRPSSCPSAPARPSSAGRRRTPCAASPHPPAPPPRHHQHQPCQHHQGPSPSGCEARMPRFLAWLVRSEAGRSRRDQVEPRRHRPHLERALRDIVGAKAEDAVHSGKAFADRRSRPAESAGPAPSCAPHARKQDRVIAEAGDPRRVLPRIAGLVALHELAPAPLGRSRNQAPRRRGLAPAPPRPQARCRGSALRRYRRRGKCAARGRCRRSAGRRRAAAPSRRTAARASPGAA